MQSTQSPALPDNSLDFLDPPQASIKEREFAQLYAELFVQNPLGAQLLAHWEETIFWKPTPVNAPATQYAADEALRQFIRGIRGQIKHAVQARSAK